MKVELRLTLFGRKTLRRTTEIPFVPPAGIKLRLDDHTTFTPEVIEYDIESGWLFLTQHLPPQGSFDSAEDMFEAEREMIARLIKLGWRQENE